MCNVLLLAVILFISVASSTSQNCVGQSDGTTLPNSNASNQFYICIGGIPIRQDCKSGLVFCSSYGFCLPNCNGAVETPVPPTATSYCANSRDGIIFPLPGSCSGYIMCQNGQDIVGECARNLAFNAAVGVCSDRVCS